MMKRLTCTALALIMLLVCLSALASEEFGKGWSDEGILGFGGEWDSGSWGVSSLPLSVGDPIHVSVMFPRRSVQPENFSEMWFSKELLKRANVVYDYILVEDSGFQEKKNLVLAAGDYPDIFIDGIRKADEQVFGPMGIFVNLAPLIEEFAPNMKELFTIYPDVEKSLTYDDGAIYNMPDFSITPRDMFSSAPYYKVSWLDNLGLQRPTTLDELYDVFIAVRDGDADGDGNTDDEIPLLQLGDIRIEILAAYGLMALPDDQSVLADYVKDDQYLFVPIQDEYRSYLEYAKKLFDEKILDSEAFVTSGEQRNAKIQTKKVFMHDGTPYGVLLNDEDWIDSYEMLGYVSAGDGSDPIWPATLRQTRSWGNFVMTDKCKYPTEMVRLMDYFYSDVGSLMIRAGREAGTYDPYGWKIVIDDPATMAWHSEIDFDKDHYDGYYQWRMANAPLQGTYVAGGFQNKLMIFSDYRNQWYSNTKLATGRAEYAAIPYPEVTYTEDEQETLMVYVDIANYVKQMETKFITGEASLDTWDSYVSTIKAMGIGDIIAVKQAAYDRWNQD
jgi:putative aldouronate transport system substrate-binding protein